MDQVSSKHKGIYISGLIGILIGIILGYGLGTLQIDKAINQHIENTQADYNNKKLELIERELKLEELEQMQQ